MFTPKFCPNPKCANHGIKTTEKPGKWYRKDGFYKTKATGTVQRFKCKSCKTRFSQQTFRLDYCVKKPISYETIIKGLISTSNLSDIARRLEVSTPTIINRQRRLMVQAIAAHSILLPHTKTAEAFVCDGFQSMVVNFYYPNNINIVVGKKSQFLYAFNHSYVYRGGKLTTTQVEERNAYYQAWTPPAADVTSKFSELLSIIVDLHKTKKIHLITDLKPDYQKAIKEHPKIAEYIAANLFFHEKISSKEERTLRNPLFPVNYMDRQFRKDLAEHVIKSISFARNTNNQMERMTIYRFYHNYLKKFRTRIKNHITHADVAGIDPMLRKKIVAAFFSERFFITRVKPIETDMKILRRAYATPLSDSQFIEKWCA
ncbi:MAG TPA: hypothetical protein ENN41_08590 [Sediminispirochaeta sp.]|nr:hypothetical protein [Sediminispirochaeta sp.]